MRCASSCHRHRLSGVDSTSGAVKIKKKDPGPGREPPEQAAAAATTESTGRDEILFQQPKSFHLGDCPICFVPLPVDPFKSTMQSCCSQVICKACCRANKRREAHKKLRHTCPMCRQPLPKTDKEIDANCTKRVAANDPVAMREVGKKHYREGSCKVAFDLWTRAADLGDPDAHYLLSLLYRDGRGVDKCEEMEWYHLEEAAIAGHAGARFALAFHENARRGRIDRAVKHLIIAARLGCDKSMTALQQCYEKDEVDKDEFTAALRAHEIAFDAMKSPQREEQARYEKACEEWFCASK